MIKQNLIQSNNLYSCSVHFQDIASHVNSIFYLNELCGNDCANCINKCKSRRYQMEFFLCSKQTS